MRWMSQLSLRSVRAGLEFGLLHTEKSERAQLFHRGMVVVMAETGAETSDDSSSDNSTTSSEYEENTNVRCVGTESEEEEDDSSSASSATESQSSSGSDESESDTSDLNAGKFFVKNIQQD